MRRACGKGCTEFFSTALEKLTRSTGSVPHSIRLPSRPKGGAKTGANPTDKGKAGSKRHLVSDRGGIPLAVVLTAANVHDSKVLEEAVDSIEPIKRPRGRPGRPRKRPDKLHADKAYDFPRCRKALRRRGISPRHASPDAGSTRARGW